MLPQFLRVCRACFAGVLHSSLVGKGVTVDLLASVLPFLVCDFYIYLFEFCGFASGFELSLRGLVVCVG